MTWTYCLVLTRNIHWMSLKLNGKVYSKAFMKVFVKLQTKHFCIFETCTKKFAVHFNSKLEINLLDKYSLNSTKKLSRQTLNTTPFNSQKWNFDHVVEFMNNLKAISIIAAVACDLIWNAAGIRSAFDVIINLNRENQFDRVQKNWACAYNDEFLREMTI